MIPLSELEKLSASERLQLVQDLWDSIAAEPDSVPVTDAQKEELDRRLDAHQTEEDESISWSKLKERLQDGS